MVMGLRCWVQVFMLLGWRVVPLSSRNGSIVLVSYSIYTLHRGLRTKLTLKAMRIAEERKSSVLASNAVHHRIDSLTSIVALFTIGGTYVFNDASWLDPVGGLLISLMVIKAGWGNTRTSLLELADTTVDDDMKRSVRKAADKALARFQDSKSVEIRDVQGMKSGQNYLMEIQLAVPGVWPVSRSREIEQVVREGIGAGVLGVKRLKVRFVPLEQEAVVDFSEEFITPEVSARADPERDEDHEHEN